MVKREDTASVICLAIRWLAANVIIGMGVGVVAYSATVPLARLGGVTPVLWRLFTSLTGSVAITMVVAIATQLTVYRRDVSFLDARRFANVVIVMIIAAVVMCGPLWGSLFSIPPLALGAVTFWVLKSSPRTTRRCGYCGYLLVDGQDGCSECGTTSHSRYLDATLGPLGLAACGTYLHEKRCIGLALSAIFVLVMLSMAARWQPFTPSAVARIDHGMTRSSVEQILGPPHALKQDCWKYYSSISEPSERVYLVKFRNDTVAGIYIDD
jgi:hypothetical protein